ncbi:MAG: hypothetical protein ABGX16_19570 [Pirellulales bacterium]
MALNIPLILHTVLEEYNLPLHGHHGVTHWARVLENGLRLAQETEANCEVVTLFAVFHDSRRVNEGTDPEHGQRGADFAAELRGNLFDLPENNFQLLYHACVGHTHERTHPDITIQTCWDSDRLDLGRVGIMPHSRYLCTEAAKAKKMIQWADDRACLRFVPELVREDWGIELPVS